MVVIYIGGILLLSLHAHNVLWVRGAGLFKSPGGEKKRVIFAKLAKQINSARKRMTRMDYNTLVTEEEEQRLSRVPVTALYEALGQVKDGRKKRGCRYSLALLLTLLLLARLAGETELRGAAHWIKLRKGWIVEHFQLKRASVPCLGTYLYALSKIDAQDLLTVVAGCLTRWEAGQRCENEPSRLAGQDGQQQKQHVAVDGKTMRGTLGHESASQPSVHVLSVYEVRTGLVLAERQRGRERKRDQRRQRVAHACVCQRSGVDGRCHAYPKDGLSAHWPVGGQIPLLFQRQ